MDGKFCVIQINKDQIVGQLITARSNRETTVSRYRFPIAPKLGDVFKIDMGVGSSFAVTELLDTEKVYRVPLVVKREYTGSVVVPAASEEQALEFAQGRAESRTDETVLLLDVGTTSAHEGGTTEVIQ